MKGVALVALALLLPVAAAAPASEAEPGCEAGQMWVGYLRTEPLREAYADAGSPGALAACEGEHWDGQDTHAAPDACVQLCAADPNGAPSSDLLDPAGARASHGDASLYVAANVGFVARVALHADASTVALYARDNTPGNILVTLRHIFSLTGGPVSEGDCDHATYQSGMIEGDPNRCGRDNTAITVEHGLLEALP